MLYFDSPNTNEIKNLISQIQEEENCPTCGQPIGEKHEKTT